MTETKKRGRKPKSVEVQADVVEETVETIAVETVEPEAPAYPTVKNYDPIIAEICSHYGAAVRSREGTVIVFEKGLNAGAINLVNYQTAEKAIEALKTTSLAR